MTLEEIEKAVAALRPDDFAKFKAWFKEFDADSWDRQIESDIKEGKLDKFAGESLADFQAGRFTKL